MKEVYLFFVFLVISPFSYAGPTVWGPNSGHDVQEVRVYGEGEIILKISPALETNCNWNNLTVTPKSAPAYEMISSIALTAHSTGKKVRVLYDGCDGNVNLVGLVLLPGN